MLAGKFKDLNLTLNEHINLLGGSTAFKMTKKKKKKKLWLICTNISLLLDITVFENQLLSEQQK